MNKNNLRQELFKLINMIIRSSEIVERKIYLIDMVLESELLYGKYFPMQWDWKILPDSLKNMKVRPSTTQQKLEYLNFLEGTLSLDNVLPNSAEVGIAFSKISNLSTHHLDKELINSIEKEIETIIDLIHEGNLPSNGEEKSWKISSDEDYLPF